jgi:inner membrane protein
LQPRLPAGTALPVSYFMKHRGITHTLAFAVYCGVLVFAATNNGSASTAALIGVLSHLLLDALTPSGVRLFWPSSLSINGRVKSGSVLDLAIFAGLTILILYLMF